MEPLALTSLVAVAALLLGASASAKSLPCVEYDRASKNASGLKESDVCISVRFHHDEGGADIVRQWGATRLEWSYEADPRVIASITSLGVPFVGTLNTIAWEGPDQDAELFDGGRTVAPWMQGFNNGRGAGWACVNKPPTLTRRQARLHDYVRAGVRTIQHDDWRFNSHACQWGACFCGYCMSGFADFLREYGTDADLRAAGRDNWVGFDYRSLLKSGGVATNEQWLKQRSQLPLSRQFSLFQLMSVRRYFDSLLAEEPVNLTVNANLQPAGLLANFVLDKIDYMVGETGIGTPQRVWRVVFDMKMADALNLPQVLSPFPDIEPKVPDVRKAIALTYALGHRMLVPWDIYVPPNKPRWFGTTEEYGDLYGFVRENAGLLDGYKAWSDIVVTTPITPDLVANERRSRDIVRYLMQAGYACRLAAFGTAGEIVHVPVSKPDFASASAVVTLPSPQLGEADQASLHAAMSGLRTVDAGRSSCRDVCNAVAGVVGPAYRVDNRNVIVLPRWKPDARSAGRVVHLVNLGSPCKVSVWLSDSICPGRPRKAVAYRPGHRPQQITLQDSSAGARAPEVDIDDWVVLTIGG